MGAKSGTCSHDAQPPRPSAHAPFSYTRPSNHARQSLPGELRVGPLTSLARCRVRYMVGWHFVPGYIRACLKHFAPVSAVDVAWMKASPGRGSMYLEGTVDADHRLHVLAVSDRLTTENLESYKDFSVRNIEATGGGAVSASRADSLGAWRWKRRHLRHGG